MKPPDDLSCEDIGCVACVQGEHCRTIPADESFLRQAEYEDYHAHDDENCAVDEVLVSVGNGGDS